MCGQRRKNLSVIVLTAGLFLGVGKPAHTGDRAARQEKVRIGMIGTLFRDIPEATVLALMHPFGALMQSQTGVNGELVPAGDVGNLGQQLADDKLQLGVFHGIEFAWARQKHPDLRPLVIAINQDRHLRAHLVVGADDPAASLKDLQGKTLALPRQTREHCYLFIERRCPQCKKESPGFFSKITFPANLDEALDDVVDGVVQVTVVDGVSLDCYKRRKPGRYAKLKIVETSEVFPAAVVAYRAGGLDDAVLKRFREGMMNANRTILGRQMLNLFKLTGFEPVPPDYEQTLVDIVKAYPPPSVTGK